MSNAELGMILFGVLGFCGFLALGAFLGKITSTEKLITYAGIVAGVAVVCFAIFSAYYFITAH